MPDWDEIQAAAILTVRDEVRTSRTILLLFFLFALLQATLSNWGAKHTLDAVRRAEKKIETLTELVFIQDAERRGIPVDSLICEGEWKAFYHSTRKGD